MQSRLREIVFGEYSSVTSTAPFRIVNRGILFCSAPSGFVQFITWPDQASPQVAQGEPPGFSVVTITTEQTTVRHHSITT